LTNQGLQVAILSNGSTGLLKSAVEHHQLGGLFDQIISAHSVSKFKPHPKVYQLAEDSLDCYADELSFQSSNAWDAIGASQYGLFTVWINRNKSHLDRLDTRVDKELSDLSGLPTLMGK
ncbi:MAG: HAD-IA family hydrolase, partial [Bacteroidota bacterium]